MTFWQGLLAARSHLAFLGGLLLALAVAVGVKRCAGEGPGAPAAAAVAGREGGAAVDFATALAVPEGELPLRPVGGALTPRERAWAEAAWAYFARNTQAETGLANSVDGFPSTTLWDTGSYLMGVLSAEALGLVPAAEADARLGKALDALARLPLCDGKLPNKAYDTRTLQMVSYDNSPAPGCIGWSALDAARIGVPFNAVVWRKPALAPKVAAVLARWDLSELAAQGALQGAERRTPGGPLERFQEGRFGYEQYAGKSLFLLGVPVGLALDYRAHVAFTEVEGQRIAFDARRPEDHGGVHNAVVSEPYVLEGVELGLDAVTLPLARAVLRAQQLRARATGKLTAVSEDQLDRPPRFAYASVLSGGKAWATFAPDGTDASALRTLSTKAAVGWGVLFAGPYPDALLDAVDRTVEPGQGLYAGVYEADGSLNRVLAANTQGVVLTALAYRVQGPWVGPGRRRAAGE